MRRTSKIAVSLPEEMLTAVEKERAESGESRSQFFRRAIEMLLRYRQEKESSQRYLQAYQEMPETKEEVAAARRSASVILGEEPWR